MLKVHEGEPVTRLTLARAPFGQPLFTVEMYSVDGWLIDCGPPVTRAQVVAFARERGVRGVVNTHQHEDHAGADAALARALGLVPLAPEATLPILACPPRVEFYRWLVWGQPEAAQARPLGEWLETGRFRFRVLPTPGHCPDHVCLWEPDQGWLFSADLFIAERAKYMRAEEDANLILESSRRMLELDFGPMFCSHAGVVRDGQAALRRKIDYWENIRGRARDLQAAGRPLPAIRDDLLGREGQMTRLSGGRFSKLNLLRSLLAKEG